MPIFRKTAIVQLELPSSATTESLPLTCERNFGVYLTIENQSCAARHFRSPINDEVWREFTRQLRDCNVKRDVQTGYHGAEFIRTLGRSLYENLAALSTRLREFLDETGVPRRLVIQTTRPELHVLPWAALYDLEGKLLATGDLSIVQCWENFSLSPVLSGSSLNLVSILGADTKKTTALSLKNLPPEITRDPAGDPEMLHMEEHGNAVLSNIGGASANAVARKFASSKLALLWSCYSSAANSWGESPALCLHRLGAAMVVSFQAELHYQDAKSISQAFYAEVFGPAASRDPETALLRIRAAKFEKEFEYANWASMTIYLRSPLDLSALPLNGARVPAAGWSDAPMDPGDDRWKHVAEALSQLAPGSLHGMHMPINHQVEKLPSAVFAAWRGNVIRLDGSVDPVSDAILNELNLPRLKSPPSDASEKLAWFLGQIARYGAPLIVWSNATQWHHDFLKVIRGNSNGNSKLTFLLLYAPPATDTVADLVDLNLLEEARAAAEGLPESCSDEELSAAYFAFSRTEMPERASEYLERIRSASEKLLLSANFVSRYCRLPDHADRDHAQRGMSDLEQRQIQEDFLRASLSEAARDGNLRDSGRARHELGYLMQTQGRVSAAEALYRAALGDLERSPQRDRRWHGALGRVLRDWADLIGRDPARLDEAANVLVRALAIQTFHGRPLEVAYSMVTWAKLALADARYSTAIETAVDAANRFEECINWRGWSAAIEILLDTLAETRETVRMLSVIDLAVGKIDRSNVHDVQRDRIQQAFRIQRARAHWIAGDFCELRKALDQLGPASSGDLEKNGPSEEVERMRRFLAMPRGI
jgi:hypothetical protein